jgi:hypothetical protein
MEVGTCCIDVLHTGRSTWVGIAMMNALSPIEKMLPTRECPFDGRARDALGLVKSGSSTTRVIDAESDCVNSSWNWSGSSAGASYESHVGETTLNVKSSAPSRSKAALRLSRGCDDCWGLSVFECVVSARQTG